MWSKDATTVGNVSIDRAVAAVSIAAVGWLLGPGVGIVNTVLGPAAGTTRSMQWLEQAAVAPEDALVRCMAAIGLVLAVRLLGGLLLALAARVPGMAGVRAARLSLYLTPPLARGFTHVVISVGLSSWTGAALSAPAFASTQPAAVVVVPTPVLAPPEATLQTWPDLGRPGTDVPTSSAPTSPAPTSTNASHQPSTPSTDPPSGLSSATRQLVPAPAATQPSPGRAGTSDTMPAAKQGPTTEVVVTPGDCLWTLAKHDVEGRSQTAPRASDIAAATEKWWQANRATIGANPDLLLPGERLAPPA